LRLRARRDDAGLQLDVSARGWMAIAAVVVIAAAIIAW